MTMFCKVLILTLWFGSCLSGYIFPQPTIEAFRPRGIKVSIPHSAGVEMFAFYGNVNEPIRDIAPERIKLEALHREGENWIAGDPNVKLSVGDKIYFWLYVQKDKLWYRQDGGNHEVRELIDEGDSKLANNNSKKPTQASPGKAVCQEVIVNLTQTLMHLQQDFDSVREINQILKDMVQKDQTLSRTLTLDGPVMDDNDLTLTVQNIIKEKLSLNFHVENVVRKSNGRVRFDVGSLDEKLQVIEATKAKLKQSRFAIIY